MTFDKTHTKDNCDKCGELVCGENLQPFPFLYLDMNDEHHTDLGDGYRQYFGCEKCIAVEIRRDFNKNNIHL